MNSDGNLQEEEREKQQEHRRVPKKAVQAAELERNIRLWEKTLKLEFLLLNLIDMNKRQKKVMKKKIIALAKLLNHEGYSAAYIVQCKINSNMFRLA